MHIINYVDRCDFCEAEVRGEGHHMLSRGATGRVCCVMYSCKECATVYGAPSSHEEAVKWAESVPGGYCDFENDYQW
jgi:hypothetical protein